MARIALLVVLLLSSSDIVCNQASNLESEDAPINSDERSNEVALNSPSEANHTASKKSLSSDCSKQTGFLDEEQKAVEVAIKIGRNHNCFGKVVEREVRGIRGYHMVVVFTRFMADPRHILIGDGPDLLPMNKYKCNNNACPPIPIPSSSNRVIIQAHPIMGDQAINVDIVAYVIATSPSMQVEAESGLSYGILYAIIAILFTIILLLCCCIVRMKPTNGSHRRTAADYTVQEERADVTEDISLCSPVSTDQRRPAIVVHQEFHSEPMCAVTNEKDSVRYLSSL